MSLEQELARNTEAMIALTAALSKAISLTGTVAATKVKVTSAEIEALKEVEPPKPVAVVVDVTRPAVSAATAFSAPAATAASPAAAVPPPTTATTASVTSATTSTIEYAQVAAAIVAVFKVDRTRVIDALARFGAAKGPQLRPEDYAEFLAMLEDAPA